MFHALPAPSDPVAEQLPLLAGYAAASIQGLVASGPTRASGKRIGRPARRPRAAT